MQVKVGCEQITWGSETPEQVMLADIAKAGYDGTPWDGVNRTASDIRGLYEPHGLVAAPGYLEGDFWDASRQQEYVDLATRCAVTSQALGLTELYIAAGGFNTTTRSGHTRQQVAGHPMPADALTDKEFAQLARAVEAIGQATLARGVRSCFHNHVGTFVETEDEIERLLASVGPEVLFLGPDTGHLAWAGVDVVEFVRRHADRIKTMHLKDIETRVRDDGIAADWDYSTFETHGLWTEVGTGSVDFASVLQLLDGAGFAGWLIVETDVTQLATPLESATISRRNLRTYGI